jgi:hypothetical protein
MIDRYPGTPPEIKESHCLLVKVLRGSGEVGDEVREVVHIYVASDAGWMFFGTNDPLAKDEPK